MQLPESDSKIKLDSGSALLYKQPTQVVLEFYTEMNRLVTYNRIPYFLLDRNNEEEAINVVESYWESASMLCNPKVLAPPNKETVERIISEAKELLGLEKKE